MPSEVNVQKDEPKGFFSSPGPVVQHGRLQWVEVITGVHPLPAEVAHEQLLHVPDASLALDDLFYKAVPSISPSDTRQRTG